MAPIRRPKTDGRRRATILALSTLLIRAKSERRRSVVGATHFGLSLSRLPPMNKRLTKISKYLTFILRHHPESIGMELDQAGFLDIEELVKNANAAGKTLTTEWVHQVVAGHDEKLFVLSDDGKRIRVNDTGTSA